MMIIDAGRFGLSQLHQLRGRVGRGADESSCLLVGDPITDGAEERLAAMVHSSDGFEIAEHDLRLRGPGDFFGTRQHGLPEMKIADVSRELELLQLAREDALAILASDPELCLPAHHELRPALQRRFGDTLALAQVG
jgi:ATP-dependent DNA helicase RecG